MGSYDYYNYYPRSTPIRREDGIKTKSRRGSIGEHWWSQRWVRYLEGLRMGARLGRGKSYARQGQVLSIDFEGQEVVARVQGSSRTPYRVHISLKRLGDKDWGRVIEILSQQAIFASKLLCGEMPPNIEEAFEEAKVDLFPAARRDLQSECSCPDHANPCKHIAAVFYILAERFDEDPFLLFQLRGRTKERLTTALRERRVNIASGNAPLEPNSRKVKPRGRKKTKTNGTRSVPGKSSKSPKSQKPHKGKKPPTKYKKVAGEAKATGRNLPVALSEPLRNRFWDTGTIPAIVIHPAPPNMPSPVLQRAGPAFVRVNRKELSEVLRDLYQKIGNRVHARLTQCLEDP